MTDDIIDRIPLLFLYPAGTGGEHVAYTASIHSSECEPLATFVNYDRNQFHTVCAFKYSATILDINDRNSCIDDRYYLTDISKRVVLKDHPTLLTLNLYKKQIPNIEIIMTVPFDELDYFAELTFKKLLVKVNSPITREYIVNYITSDATDFEISYIIDQVGLYEWVWQHEIHVFLGNLREGKRNVFVHIDDVQLDIDNHKNYLNDCRTQFVTAFSKSFYKFHIVNCDSLRYDSREFWNNIKNIITSLNVDAATDFTNKWIAQNNQLGFKF